MPLLSPQLHFDSQMLKHRTQTRELELIQWTAINDNREMVLSGSGQTGKWGRGAVNVEKPLRFLSGKHLQ